MSHKPLYLSRIPESLTQRLKAESRRRKAENEPYPTLQEVASEAIRIGLNILEESTRKAHDREQS